MLHFLGGGQGEDSTGSLYQGPEGNSRDPGFGQNTLRDLPRGNGCGIGEDNDFRDSNERSSGCGIPVKKERECWISRLLFLESAGYVLKKLSAKGQERATEEECLLLNIFRFD